ncbi:MAG: nucleotidyl transferase AbiEii/AbiGii toxin family protein [Bacteroidales bacterium]|nr:nucleotidyl transferase AbiEii/AbiGii toxin family protein [Bacteroidales bacterium]
MYSGLTDNLNAIIEDVAQMKCIEPYVLCGGTALSLQLEHRKSEDLDFMQWRISKQEKPEVNWPVIKRELEEVLGSESKMDLLGFDQALFFIHGAKLSFYVSDKYSPGVNPISLKGNIRIADMDSIMAMKIEVMARRGKFRDYYDIYAMLKAGCSIKKGILNAGVYSGHNLSTKNMVSLLISAPISPDPDFLKMDPIYNVDIEDIRKEIRAALIRESVV